MHDADYRQSQKDFNSFVECLTEKIIEKDATIPELPSKDLVCVPLLDLPRRPMDHLIKLILYRPSGSIVMSDLVPIQLRTRSEYLIHPPNTLPILTLFGQTHYSAAW